MGGLSLSVLRNERKVRIVGVFCVLCVAAQFKVCCVNGLALYDIAQPKYPSICIETGLRYSARRHAIAQPSIPFHTLHNDLML